MAKNRHSNDCLLTTKFDREVKRRFLPMFSVPRTTNLRGILRSSEEAREIFMAYLSDELRSKELSEEDVEYINNNDVSDIIATINGKLRASKEDEVYLTKFEELFMSSYANALIKFSQDCETKSILKREMDKAGIQTASISKMHELFKSKIPAEDRREVRTQLLSLVMNVLDRAEERPEYQNYTRTEIIDVFHLKSVPHLQGFHCLMYQAKRFLKARYEELKEESEAAKARIANGETKDADDVPFGDYIMSESQERLFNILLNDNDAWTACVYETKTDLLNAEKIKIGNKLDYVEDVEDEDTDVLDPDKDVSTAEEENPEHWMIKPDTVSSFNSMAREVRSLLYRLTTGTQGKLGFPSIVDVMLIHQSLQDLRGENYCQNSSEFLEVLRNTNTSWAQELYDILINDPWKRTSVFNAYRKNHLNYDYHRKSSFYDRERGMSFPTFFINRSGKDTKVLMGAYVAGVLHIDADNTECLFDNSGMVIPDKLKNAKLHFENKESETGQFEEETYDDEGKRDFVGYVNNLFNLHLDSSDVDIILSSAYEFKEFCKSAHAVMKGILSIGGRNISIYTCLQDTKGTYKYFQNLVRRAKHTITVQERNSPVERSFRYNKSTYMTHTVPNSLGDNLERLGKYAALGIQEFKSYLEETYLSCPVFATKTQTGYTIHNHWLKLLYNSTEADLKNPASFVNRFINDCTRGLGVDDAEFSTFSEKDNYLYTLNEYLQNSVKSDGKLGATPLFVTGDSNSTRFLTTPILSSEECLNGMVENVIQEIKRMQTFEAMVDYFNNPDNVDPNSPDYSKRRQIKVSEGHGGKTVEEWMKEPEHKRPSILRTQDKFTFFPFLNEHKDSIIKEYRKAIGLDLKNTDELDPTAMVNFRNSIKALLKENLDRKYEAFMTELLDRQIVEKSMNHYYLNTSTIAVQNSENKIINPEHQLLDMWNFYLNTKFNLIQEEQFLTIDSGFYKNTEDFQKRFKENIAAGDLLDLEALDPSDPTKKIDDNNGKQNVIYFDEQLTDLDASDEEGGSLKDRLFMKALRMAGFSEDEVMRKYKKNTLTDGQSWRSFTSYRKLMIMRGEPFWSKAHEEVYQIIQGARSRARENNEPSRLTKEELQRILDLGVVFQPLKPFYYGFEEIPLKNGEKSLVPVQHKYSEYPIIPELMPIRNSKDADKVNKLNALGQAMEENGIDLACCTTCVKVGGFGSISVKGCQSKEDFQNAFNGAYIHQLPLEGWRQQSNIPEHVDSSRAMGTQAKKHMYGCIDGNGGNKHYGFLKRIFKRGKIKLSKTKEINVEDGLNENNLIQLTGALGSAHYIHASNKVNDQISDPREASDILSELRANDTRGAKDNISAYNIDEDGEFLMSPSEGIMAADNMASLLSKLRKEVIKHPIKGGSAVQVSAWGFEDVLKVNTKEVNTKDGKKLNIVYADCAVPFAFSYSFEDGTTVDLSTHFLEYVDYDTGMLLDEKGEPVEPEEPTGEPGKEFYGWNTKLGKQFPGILDMIAYRIPTEKDYSILNLKAKRFFPKTAGGTIMVPSQFTTIAGFDFRQYWSH